MTIEMSAKQKLVDIESLQGHTRGPWNHYLLAELWSGTVTLERIEAAPVDVLASVNHSLLTFIHTRDKRYAEAIGYNTTQLLDNFVELLQRGVVTVGGRTTCGQHTDPSWKLFVAWNEIVKKARKCGYNITELDIKQKNTWATANRGFWDEREYRMQPLVTETNT